MPSTPLRFSMLLVLACAVHVSAPSSLPAQQTSTSRLPENNGAAEGKRIFASTCAACHGLDGRGGERGPDISRRREIQRLSDQALLRIIQEGVPGTGMPAFGYLGNPQVQALVRHLRSLQGQSATALPGDPRRGKAVFLGDAACSQCHTVNGEGGFIGPDLSSYAGTQTVADIRSAVTDPNKNLDPRKRPVTVITMNGQTRTGIARNEDNFSLQLQSTDGAFHLFNKSELQSVEYQPRSLMPDNYGSRLTRQELDDLVSYLISVARTRSKPQAEKE